MPHPILSKDELLKCKKTLSETFTTCTFSTYPTFALQFSLHPQLSSISSTNDHGLHLCILFCAVSCMLTGSEILYQFPRDAIINYHKPDALKQLKFILSLL